MADRNAYPSAIRTLLKTGPAFVVYTLFGMAFTGAIYAIIYHPHDRIEKFHFKSNKFERLVRRRDDKLRNYWKPEIDWQPT